MKFKKLKTGKEVNISVDKYYINWDKQISKPQKAVKDFVYPLWKYDNVLEEFVIPGSRLRIDILNLSKKIAIEVSPDSTHKNFNKFMHGSRATGYLNTFKRDSEKIKWIEENGFDFIEITDTELKNLNKKDIETKFNVIL